MREDLVLLGRQAREWARTYAAVTEALIQEGVPEERARQEAREVATFALFCERVEDEGEQPPW